MKIMSVVGARPNFMKISPFVNAIMKHNQANGNDSAIEHYLVHTGQHYDVSMSEAFFNALNIPNPDISLEIGSGSHAEQVGRTMIEFEKVVKANKPDWVVVVGDVNATCACSIVAKKEHINLAHIESGLRSRDMNMPEEINRLVTDRLSDLLFTTDEIASMNLRMEGVPEVRIKFVGNIMIDTLMANKEKAQKLALKQIVSINALEDRSHNFNSNTKDYALITLHRPSNVDLPDVLGHLIDFFCDEVCNDMPIIWPIHPRTCKNLKTFGLWKKVVGTVNMVLLNPIGYHEMLRLNMGARLMLTDSGGLQEECCVLGTPCLTLRWNTERPVTLKEHGGVSVLVGNVIDRIRQTYNQTLQEKCRPMQPALWDGRTAERILRELILTSSSCKRTSP